MESKALVLVQLKRVANAAVCGGAQEQFSALAVLGLAGRARTGGRLVVAEERPFACATVDERAQGGSKRLRVSGVAAVGPDVVQSHGDQGYQKEGRIYVGDKIGLVV